jgi:hypothetical protein
LGQSPNTPIADLDLGLSNRQGCGGRQEGSTDSIGPGVVGPDFGEVLQIASEPPQEVEVLSLIRVESLKVVDALSQREVKDSQIAQSKLPFSYKVLQKFELRPSLLELLNLQGLIVLVPEKRSDLLQGIIQHSGQVVNLSLILHSLAQQISFSRALGDVFDNGSGLSQFEVSVKEVGDVREIKAEIELVLLEPFLLVLVLDLCKVEA